MKDVARPQHAAAQRLSLSVRPLPDLDSCDLAEWSRLARRALEPNPFQQPEFVLSLADLLLPAADIRLIIVRDDETGEWLLVQVALDRTPTPTRPLRHLRALASAYSFLDQPLVRADRAAEALAVMFENLSGQRYWHGIRYWRLTTGGTQGRLLLEAAQSAGAIVYPDRAWERPMYAVEPKTREALLEDLSKSRRKSLRKAWRWLESQGEVRFRIVAPDARDLTPAEEFLRLESLGWKGDLGTSMNCKPTDREFFLKMIAAFSESGDALFGELSVDGTVIASTCNLRAGNVLFGFKIGWDTDFANGSPGLWSELLLLEAVPNHDPKVQWIDSCSHADSYVASLYHDRAETSAGVFVWSRRADALCLLRQNLRLLKQQFRGEETDSEEVDTEPTAASEEF